MNPFEIPIFINKVETMLAPASRTVGIDGPTVTSDQPEQLSILDQTALTSVGNNQQMAELVDDVTDLVQSIAQSLGINPSDAAVLAATGLLPDKNLSYMFPREDFESAVANNIACWRKEHSNAEWQENAANIIAMIQNNVRELINDAENKRFVAYTFATNFVITQYLAWKRDARAGIQGQQLVTKWFDDAQMIIETLNRFVKVD
jgi:hypothetical protein